MHGGACLFQLFQRDHQLRLFETVGGDDENLGLIDRRHGFLRCFCERMGETGAAFAASCLLNGFRTKVVPQEIFASAPDINIASFMNEAHEMPGDFLYPAKLLRFRLSGSLSQPFMSS